MINLTKLLLGEAVSFPGDRLRYGGAFGCPVVVWHLTGACNLACRHCYAAAPDQAHGADSRSEEMSPSDAALFLARLSAIRPPALLFSGGDPLMHPRFFEHLALARSFGLNVAVSTNGTRIDRAAAERIARAGVSYVGVSLDGIGEAHDAFRGQRGSFGAAVAGIEALRAAKCRTGLRVTLARPVIPQLREIFALAEELGVGRVCFYHFIPSGRGGADASLMPPKAEERRALWEMLDWTARVVRGRSNPIEVLTVGEGSDGPLLYSRLIQSERAEAASLARPLLQRAARRRIGSGIASVRWDGALFRDQFSWDEPIGSWRDLPLKPIEERRGACLACAWAELCPGSLRMDRGYECMLSKEERVGKPIS